MKANVYHPCSISVDCDGNIFVGDACSCSVNVFSGDGNFKWKFGSQGKDDGMFGGRIPGISISKENNIIVVDRSNKRIQIFDSNGKYLLKFGSAGKGDGQFNDPFRVTTNESN